MIPEVQQPALEEQVLTNQGENSGNFDDMRRGGEGYHTQQFPDMFDQDPYYVNSSDSWTLETDETSSSSSPRIPASGGGLVDRWRGCGGGA